MQNHFADLPENAAYLRGIGQDSPKEALIQEIDFAKLSSVLMLFEQPDLYQYVRVDGFDNDLVKGVVDKLYKAIIYGNLTPVQIGALQDLWDYLAAADSDELKPADMIFVFGGPEETKARKAAELYHQGLASRIVFTGDTQRALVDTPHESESIRDQKIAIAHGVPPEAILIESKSFNTPLNVQNALSILAPLKPFPTRFILVNLPWYLRRATYTFLNYWRDAPEPAQSVQKVNATSEQFDRNTYFRDRRGLEYVVFEYLKLRQARAMMHM